jgi:glycosyltransferase involved in cell wall biosynthesis
MSAPAVSVLLITFDHERWVHEALDSLAAQTFDDFEVIIVDDHSNDTTVEVIREWLRRNDLPAQLVVNDRNLGVAAVMNAGLRVARGRFVSGLSGDDRMMPRLLELQHTALSSSADDVAGVFSDMRLIDSRGHELGPSWLETMDALPPPSTALFRRLLSSPSNFLPSPAMMVKRAALDAVGPYDETLIFEDYDMWLRLVDRFELRFVPGTLVDYRLHPNNFSRRPDRAIDFLIDVGRVKLKWRDHEPDVDWTNARRIWSQGHNIMSENPISGRRLLELAEELVPTPAAALALELDWRRERSAVEHAAERKQSAAAEREKHAAELEQHARTTNEAAIQVERLEERVDGQVREIEQLLDSRWLRLLDVFERPLRRIRPGLGTVRERLRQIRDRLEH